VREASYNDAFVQGMTDIFNETPSVRDGSSGIMERISKRLSGNSPISFREELIGAYYGDELVGFAMLANAGKYGVLDKLSRR